MGVKGPVCRKKAGDLNLQPSTVESPETVKMVQKQQLKGIC